MTDLGGLLETLYAVLPDRTLERQVNVKEPGRKALCWLARRGHNPDLA